MPQHIMTGTSLQQRMTGTSLQQRMTGIHDIPQKPLGIVMHRYHVKFVAPGIHAMKVRKVRGVSIRRTVA